MSDEDNRHGPIRRHANVSMFDHWRDWAEGKPHGPKVTARTKPAFDSENGFSVSGEWADYGGTFQMKDDEMSDLVKRRWKRELIEAEQRGYANAMRAERTLAESEVARLSALLKEAEEAFVWCADAPLTETDRLLGKPEPQMKREMEEWWASKPSHYLTTLERAQARLQEEKR